MAKNSAEILKITFFNDHILEGNLGKCSFNYINALISEEPITLKPVSYILQETICKICKICFRNDGQRVNSQD